MSQSLRPPWTAFSLAPRMTPVGRFFISLGIASAEQNVVGDECCAEAPDDVEDGFSPALFAATLEAGEADVLLVGAGLFCRGDGRVRGG